MSESMSESINIIVLKFNFYLFVIYILMNTTIVANYFKNKYLKYKYKYLTLKEQNLNHKEHEQIESQTGGNYLLYIDFVRLEINKIPIDIAMNLINQSVRLNRYYHSYSDDKKMITEGISPRTGPIGFNIKEIDTRNYGIDQYESVLIYPILVKLNDLLAKYNVSTIQSGVAYYCDDIEFYDLAKQLPFLQLPFIEFIGNRNTIPIMKKIVNHPLLAKYYTTSNYDIFSDGSLHMRTCIIRPYLSEPIAGQQLQEQVFDFDDTEFWADIQTAVKDVSDENIKLTEITTNDPELDRSKKWYILNKQGQIIDIYERNKEKFNPLNKQMPLSTLDVRYEPKLELFKKKL